MPMSENKGTRADLPPEGGVDEVRYVTTVPVNVEDLRMEYTGEGGDGQTERVGDGNIS